MDIKEVLRSLESYINHERDEIRKDERKLEIRKTDFYNKLGLLESLLKSESTLGDSNGTTTN